MYGEAPSNNGQLPDDQSGPSGVKPGNPSSGSSPNGLPGSISATNSSSPVASTADLTLYIVFGVAILVFVLVLIIIVKILKRKNPNPNGYTLTSTGKFDLPTTS